MSRIKSKAPPRTEVPRVIAEQRRLKQEAIEQKAVFDYLKLWHSRIPILAVVHAIPNGEFMPDPVRAAAVERGLTAGVWDIHIPVRRVCAGNPNCCRLTKEKLPLASLPREHPGAWIEMKWKDNTLTPEQRWFRESLEAQNFSWYVCYNWMEGVRAVLSYLDLIDSEAWEALPPK